jgi:hypothetical protein
MRVLVLVAGRQIVEIDYEFRVREEYDDAEAEGILALDSDG